MPTASERTRERRSAAREIALFLHALRLAAKVQGVRTRPLDEVVRDLVRTRRLPRASGADEASRAAGRACARVRRWAGGLDTCLTRSLVAGALLADQAGVVLHGGFRGAVAGAPADGHAWVTLDGRDVTPANDGAHAGPFLEALQLPLSRAERG